MHYLYRITNQLNGKIYIGQTQNPTRRWSSHKSSAKKEAYNKVIAQAFRKHGIINFSYEIIAMCKTQEDTDSTEVELIKQYDSLTTGHGYNVKPGGDVVSGWHHSEETRKKISESNMGKEMPPHTKEWKNNMSAIMTGREITWADKISAAQIGKEISEEARHKMSLSKIGSNHPNYGKQLSDEIKEKISSSLIGKVVSEETKKKNSDSHKGKSPSEETRKKVSLSMKSKTWKLVDGKRVYSERKLS